MTTVLHITPHLGGGVGKALAGLVAQNKVAGTHIKHVIACLEKPEKNQFIKQIRYNGTEVIISPNWKILDELIASADIVQLEWWNHPATIECLCNIAPQPMRLLVWCHVSGLHNPIIPPKLMEASNSFLFTSPCSFEAKQVTALAARLGSRLAVISSGGGFSDFPKPENNDENPFSVGYMGSLNFAKLHPDYIDYLSAVEIPDFKVRLIGDLHNRETLEKQSKQASRPNILDFRGYATDVATELSAINVLAYLLNPHHYGTAENALLEAMSMGIVPIVLNNPAELNIVEHLRTGLVVRSQGEFADAIEWLAHNPEERAKIGQQASASIRERFSLEKMSTSFCAHYEELLCEKKQIIPFKDIFGTTPEEWFLSCQNEPEIFCKDGKIDLPTEKLSSFSLMEKTKGSVFHFLEYFPDAVRLQAWANNLESTQ